MLVSDISFLDNTMLAAYDKLKYVLGSVVLTDLADLQVALGVSFKDTFLLRQSLTHRSYLNENPDSDLASNERLEFLGDAVLGFVVAEKLYSRFPDFSAILRLGENDLHVPNVTFGKPTLAIGQIEIPEPTKAFIEPQGLHFVQRCVKSLTPVPQCLLIVPSQVFQVHHSQITGPGDGLADGLHAQQAAAGKHMALDKVDFLEIAVPDPVGDGDRL